MNTTTTTPVPAAKTRRFRSSLRTIWQESVAAHRAMARLTPYVDQPRDDGR